MEAVKGMADLLFLERPFSRAFPWNVGCREGGSGGLRH